MIARRLWADDGTLVIDYDEGPGLNKVTPRVQFEGARVLFETPGVVNMEGRLKI